MENFTIIVPTRNRADTLQACLRSCLAQDYERLTVLVSDNCSTDNTREVVASFDDKRLRYTRPAQPCSITDNFEHAFATALETNQTGYITAIGDDDGLLADGLAHANDALQSHPGIEALTWQVSTYCWPTCGQEEWRNNLQLAIGNDIRVLDARDMLGKALAYRAYFHHLPGPLTSLVSSRVLKHCREKRGSLAISVAHDAGMAVHLACVIPRYAFTQRSVTIAGSSGHSVGNGLSRLNDETFSKFLQSATFPPHEEMRFTPNAVYYMTDAFLRARDADLLPQDMKINIPLALRLMLIRNPANPEPVYQHIVQSAAASAARHGIRFHPEKWREENESENAGGTLFRDPVLFEHERWISTKCDPRYIRNIFDAIGLARHFTLALDRRAVLHPEDFRTKLSTEKAKLEKARDKARMLQSKLAEGRKRRKTGLLNRLRDRLRSLRSR